MNTSNPTKCLLVDDNKVARIILKKIVGNINGIDVIGECENAMEARAFLESSPVDILFLDIEMPGMNGLDLLKSLPERPYTILTTAREHYAAEAFELNVVDYLVKPFTLTRVFAAIDKVKELVRFKQSQQTETITSRNIFIKEQKAIRKINVDDILWVEAKGDYIQFHLPGRTYMVHESLRAIEERFSPEMFIRVHRGYIIAIDKVEYIDNKFVYIKKHPIPISDSYKKALQERFHLL